MTHTPEQLIAHIEQRCTEDGDCLLWNGATSENGMPRLYLGKYRGVSARRVLYEARRGSLAADRLVSPTCGHKACMARAHLQALTVIDSRAIAARRGAYKSMARVIKRTLTLRAKSHITEQVVASIRDAESAMEAHAQTGVSLPHCYQIRNGKSRGDLVSPFAGLGAR
jgi:hypothetical protein